MDWSQVLYATLLALAIWVGRPGWGIALAMVANLAATMVLAGDPLAVGMADLVVCSWLLAIGTRQALIVAAIFATMQPVYVAAWAFGWPGLATYAIVDALAFAQLWVISGASGGHGDGWRAFARRRGSAVAAAPSRVFAGAAVARDLGPQALTSAAPRDWRRR